MKTRFLPIIAASSLLIIPMGYFLWVEYGTICNNAVTGHLQKYSNLFDDGTTHETNVINDIGLPFGLHPGNLQECVDYTLGHLTVTELAK